MESSSCNRFDPVKAVRGNDEAVEAVPEVGYHSEFSVKAISR